MHIKESKHATVYVYEFKLLDTTQHATTNTNWQKSAAAATGAKKQITFKMIHSKHMAPACLFHFLHMKTCSSSSFSVSAAIWQLCGHFGSAPQDAQQLLSSQCRSCGAGSSYIWLLGLCRRPCRSEHTVSLVNTFFFFFF